jgi:hypothetical protein
MKLIVFLLATSALLSAAPPTVLQQGSPSGDVMIAPQAVPTSLTVVSVADSYLKSITVTNTTASAVTFTVQTAGGVAILSAVSIAANTTYIVSWPDGQLFYSPAGFSVQAGAAGLNYQANWKQ